MYNVTYKRSSFGEYSKDTETVFLELLTKNRKHIFGFSGRTIIREIFASLQIPSGSCVLVPEFYPEGIKLPLDSMGMKIIPYCLNQDFSPSLESIHLLLLSNSVKVVFLIHYFGKFYDFLAIIEILSSHGVFVVEDCAQSLFTYINREYGYKSIILYSFPKFLSVPSGALAVFNIESESLIHTPSILNKRDAFFAFLSVTAHTISLILRKFQKSASNILVFIPIRFFAAVFYVFYYKLLCMIKSPAPISSSVYNYLVHFDYKEFMRLRSVNYNIIREKLRIEPGVGSFLNEDNFLGFAVQTTPSARKVIRENLKKFNIEVLCYQQGWNHEKINPETSAKLSESFFIIPVNEHIQSEKLEEAINKINLIVSQHGATLSEL